LSNIKNVPVTEHQQLKFEKRQNLEIIFYFSCMNLIQFEELLLLGK